MTIKIENIRPDYDRFNETDILSFTINGERRGVFLQGHSLGLSRVENDKVITDYGIGRCLWTKDDTLLVSPASFGERNSDQLTPLSESDRSEIYHQLAAWIAENKNKRFSKTSTRNPDVESIEHGLNVSDGVIVWLTEEAAGRLNLDGYAYGVSRNGDVSWVDRDFGEQYCENTPESDGEQSIRTYNLKHPEDCIFNIETRLEQLREEIEAELEDEDELEDDDEYSAESVRSLTL
ncbi:hypothetical protein F9K77_07150 [Ochrobactrum sp. LMG 5442]|nr:hypothetical protein F9K77_07150 [Ochrobactrum sp. LMG 5442]